jgi:mannose-6-phosphate isomerase-like protein (cupin superfamily)
MIHAHAIVTRSTQSRSGEVLRIGPNECRVLVSSLETAGAMSLLEWRGVGPGGPPLHVHPDQDEVFIVEEGSYRFQCGDETFALAAGDSIFLPRNVPHSFAQTSTVGRLRYLYSPAGSMIEFFRGLSQLAPTAPPDDASQLFAIHGMQIVGPPLPVA